MLALVVIERQPRAEVLPRFCNRGVGVCEHSFVFQTAPQALDKNVVQIAAFAVHAPKIKSGKKLPPKPKIEFKVPPKKTLEKPLYSRPNLQSYPLLTGH